MPVIATDSFNFNPPTRKGWDSCAAGISNALEEFQSTHPQGVGPAHRAAVLAALLISIHPPARGGTDCVLVFQVARLISIHPPARGGTSHPRPDGHGRRISIHPPARGGTLLLDALKERPVFQSTHPQGVGQAPSARFHGRSYFNPPTRKGWDYSGCSDSCGIVHFNPPTRKGWDSKSSQNELCILCKSNKIALVSSSRPTFFSCHLSINCYLAYFFGAIPSKYFCSLHLRTAKLFKHFTAYSHIWQQNQEYTWRFSIMSYH